MSIIEKALDKLDQDQGNIAQRNRPLNRGAAPAGANAKSFVSSQVPGLMATGSIPGEQKVQDLPVKTAREFDLDLDALKRRKILTPGCDDRKLVDEFRRIKRPILMKAFDDNAPTYQNSNIIMVTSSLQGEGKSYVALNLAISNAMEIDRTVLLVDADVPMRTLSSELGTIDEKGITDYLQDDEIELADILLKTNIPNLTLLPPGGVVNNLSELWASERMNSLMAELSNRYSNRLIIFDTPPLLAETSGSVLGSSVGQIVMVVEAEKTPQHAVKEALQLVDDCENKSIVLNKSYQKASTDYSYGTK